jgi:hypothetical protein
LRTASEPLLPLLFAATFRWHPVWHLRVILILRRGNRRPHSGSVQVQALRRLIRCEKPRATSTELRTLAGLTYRLHPVRQVKTKEYNDSDWDLPEDWDPARDAKGRLFYVNQKTKETRWDASTVNENNTDADASLLDGLGLWLEKVRRAHGRTLSPRPTRASSVTTIRVCVPPVCAARGRPSTPWCAAAQTATKWGQFSDCCACPSPGYDAAMGMATNPGYHDVQSTYFRTARHSHERADC